MNVFTVNKHGEPMMPCHPARARELLKQKRARIYKRIPFTIQVVDREEFETQDIELKLDPGSNTTGVAIVQHNPKEAKTVWQANLRHRGQQIKDDLEKRRGIRRGRRNRKTRYRKARFDNRKREEGWLPPSLVSRVDNVVTWAKRLLKYLPITSIAVETVRFDTQKMMNPEISGVEYQQGELMGYEVREYLLEKFKRSCVYCGITDVPLEVEHIVPKSRGGSNRVFNLTLSCRDCNLEKGNKPLEQFITDADHRQKILQWAKQPLTDAAAVNATRYRIGNEVKKLGVPVSFWSGGRTKKNRIHRGYPKDHWIDAACVGSGEEEVVVNPYAPVLEIKATGRGSRQMCRTNKYGFHRTKAKAVKRIHGFQTGDMVELSQDTGKYRGTFQGKVVVRNSGTFDIVTTERKISATWKKFRLLQRFDGYQYSIASA